ncbi:hypothetical protein KR093_007583 [Drosophila rubida]|uniref:Uncharacterized protein n=1 Tax=Drosophila rubida TaxID=30044 RepID=A0AAD4PK98_9MUSC|nr:hypothetical protein KR093_007583 [Drosophila rubida]
MRDLQFVATASLLFGIFKAHARHKAKFMLLWLVITVYCCLSMLNAGAMLLCPRVDIGRISFLWILFVWSLAAAVAYLWNIMYNEYVELTIEVAPPAVEVDSTAQAPTKHSSKYPNTEGLTVLVHGKKMDI